MIWVVRNFSSSSPTQVGIYLHQVLPKQHLATAWCERRQAQRYSWTGGCQTAEAAPRLAEVAPRGLHGRPGFHPEASFQTGIRPSRYSRGSASAGTHMPSLTHPQFDTACWSLSLRSKKNAPAAGSNELCLWNANSQQTWERKNTKNILAYWNTILKSAGWVLWKRDVFFLFFFF